MMTLNKARRLAVEGLARLSLAPPVTLRDDLTECSRRGWRFVGDRATVFVGHDGSVQPTVLADLTLPPTQRSPSPATPDR